MWRDSITIYRENICDVERIVANGCHIEYRVEEKADITGSWPRDVCFLTAPAGTDIRPGDRICDGIGPEQRPEALPRIAWVKPFFVDGKLHHLEAEAV